MSVRVTASMLSALAGNATANEVKLRALSLRASADRSLTASAGAPAAWADGLFRRFGVEGAAALVALAEASLAEDARRRHLRHLRLATQRERLVAQAHAITRTASGFLGPSPFAPKNDLDALALVARALANKARQL